LNLQGNPHDLEQLPAFSHTGSELCRSNDISSVILGRENGSFCESPSHQPSPKNLWDYGR
jgi:hypothetical protein